MDYRNLLKRYIRHVDTVEGSNFIPNHPPEGEPIYGGILTLDEVNELQKLEEEGYADADREAAAT